MKEFRKWSEQLVAHAEAHPHNFFMVIIFTLLWLAFTCLWRISGRLGLNDSAPDSPFAIIFLYENLILIRTDGGDLSLLSNRESRCRNSKNPQSNDCCGKHYYYTHKSFSR